MSTIKDEEELYQNLKNLSIISLYLANSRQFLAQDPGSRNLSSVVYGDLMHTHLVHSERIDGLALLQQKARRFGEEEEPDESHGCGKGSQHRVHAP